MGLFKNLNIKRDYRNSKTELIQPFLYGSDSIGIRRAMDYNIEHMNGNDLTKLAKSVTRIAGKGEAVPADALHKAMKEVYVKFPKEVIDDLFNQYYNPINKLKYSNRDETNTNRFKMIDRANDPVMKMLTEGSNLNTMVFTQQMMQYILSMLAVMKIEDPQEFEKMMQNLKNEKGNDGEGDGDPQEGEGEGDEQDGEEGKDPKDGKGGNNAGKGNTDRNTDINKQLQNIMDRFMNGQNQEADNLYKDLMNKAKERVEQIEETIEQDKQDEVWDKLGGGGASKTEIQRELQKLDPEVLKKIQKELSAISMNMNAVKDKIKGLLDKTVSFFSAREEDVYESFMDNPIVESLQEFEYLHPAIRTLFLDDLQTKDTIHLGRINVYVDVSGSMSASAGVKDASQMSRLTFAKALVMKLKEMDMLNRVFSFEYAVREHGNTMADILTIDGSGGTNLNAVVQHIKKVQENSLIITDAEDHVSEYSEYAYFIGVAGASFYRTEASVMKKYHARDQMVVFAGTHIQSVDVKGQPITK